MTTATSIVAFERGVVHAACHGARACLEVIVLRRANNECEIAPVLDAEMCRESWPDGDRSVPSRRWKVKHRSRSPDGYDRIDPDRGRVLAIRRWHVTC